MVQVPLSSARSCPDIKKTGEEPVTGTGVKSLQPKVKAINATQEKQSMSLVFLKRLSNKHTWKRLLYERLSEPLHLNLMSLFVLIFGNLRLKIDFDLIIRQHHAYALLDAADQAKRLGYKQISVFEFGVAAGAGLLNLQGIANKITAFTGVSIRIFGFDTGSGMPPPVSYKDHPELYQAGDFPMNSMELSEKLDGQTRLILGPIVESINNLNIDFSDAPIAFISLDVDYFSSSVDALKLLEYGASNYLPRVIIYLDDVEELSHNSFCGEEGAVREFTRQHPNRPIERHVFCRGHRLFKNARWIDHMYQCHILDHPIRNNLTPNRDKVVLNNPYL